MYKTLLYCSQDITFNKKFITNKAITKNTLLFIEYCYQGDYETLHNILFFNQILFDSLEPQMFQDKTEEDM